MTADEVAQFLQLKPHPLEGGFFRETYRSRWMVSGEYLPQGISGSRSIGTAIYYLITPESFSPLHRLSGSEIFHFYAGDPVLMLQLLPDSASRIITMGE
jgi:predicted cupin superfamily sugar epimerase